MLSFSLVAEALKGLIYHILPGEKIPLSLLRASSIHFHIPGKMAVVQPSQQASKYRIYSESDWFQETIGTVSIVIKNTELSD